VGVAENWRVEILRNDLRRLAGKMRFVADTIERVFPGNGNAEELRGASGMVDSWANNIEVENG
jgi:hypothetical protein